MLLTEQFSPAAVVRQSELIIFESSNHLIWTWAAPDSEHRKELPKKKLHKAENVPSGVSGFKEMTTASP